MWRGEDDSKAQPDVAGRPALGLATIRGGPAGREGGGAGHPRVPGRAESLPDLQ